MLEMLKLFCSSKFLSSYILINDICSPAFYFDAAHILAWYTVVLYNLSVPLPYFHKFYPLKLVSICYVPMN